MPSVLSFWSVLPGPSPFTSVPNTEQREGSVSRDGFLLPPAPHIPWGGGGMRRLGRARVHTGAPRLEGPGGSRPPDAPPFPPQLSVHAC